MKAATSATGSSRSRAELSRARFLVGDFEVDPSSGTVRSRAGSTRVEPKVMDVLVFLAQQPGTTLSRREILDAVWPDTFVTDDVLTRAISELRRALGESPRGPGLIETVPKRGYRLSARVRLAESPPTAARRWRWWVLGVVALAGVALGLWLRADRVDRSAPIGTIAVLPFESTSEDSQLTHLRFGLGIQLRNRLARVPGLTVVSTGGTRLDPPSGAGSSWIRDELGADAVVRGAIEETGGQLVVDVEIISFDDQRLVWGGRFVRDRSSWIDLDAVMAGEIAAALGYGTGLRQSVSSELPGSTMDPLAYDLYLKGLVEWNRRVRTSLRAAELYFEQALDRDPAFARAYVGSADTHFLLGLHLEPPNEEMPRALRAAERALALAPDLAEAYATRGLIALHYDWDWAEAERFFRRSLELDRGSAVVHYYYSTLLMTSGRTDLAVRELEIARSLEPLSPVPRVFLGVALLLSGQADLAEAEVEAALEGDPGFVLGWRALSWIREASDRLGAAIEAQTRAFELSGDNYELASLARLRGIAGDPEATLELGAELRGRSGRGYVSPLYFAWVAMGAGLEEQIFDDLRAAIDVRDGNLIWLAVDPRYRSIRERDDFRALVQRVGIPLGPGS